MDFTRKLGFAVLFVISSIVFGTAQQSYTYDPVPHLVRFSGVLPGGPRTLSVTFSFYKEQNGGLPNWQETHQIAIDGIGRYTVLLGANHPEGIPLDVVSSGDARWLEVHPEGEAELPRFSLVSVPYALKAADAETLNGKPFSAFLTHEEFNTVLSSNTFPSTNSGLPAGTKGLSLSGGSSALDTGTTGYVPLWLDNAGTIGNSHIFDNGFVGIGTSSPEAQLHIVGPNPRLRIDNYGTAASELRFVSTRGSDAAPAALLSGDAIGQITALGYGATAFPSLSRAKILFLATENWTDAANGTAMTFETTSNGTRSRTERLRIDQSGRVGIGTSNPEAQLHIVGPSPRLRIDNYGTAASELRFVSTRGNATAPAALLSGDAIGQITSLGFGATAFPSLSKTKILFLTTEDWTDSANGTAMTFETTANGTTNRAERLRIDHNGNVGIGITTPSQKLSVSGTIESTIGGFKFPDGTTQSTATSPLVAGDSSISIANNTVRVSVGGVGTTALADGGVTSSKLDPAIISNIASKATLAANSFAGSQSAIINDPLGVAAMGQNQATSGGADGVRGESFSTAGRGVYGFASNVGSSASATGVYGLTKAGLGNGVYGEGASTSGANNGVFGLTRSSSGVGVFGQATSTLTTGLNRTKGVYGLVAGENGSAGVFGQANNTSAQTTQYGVYGIAQGVSGVGVYGEADTLNTTGQPIGVVGIARSSAGYAAKFFKYSTSGDVIAAYSAANSSMNPTLIMRVDGTGNLRATGTITGGGADFAEMISTAPTSRPYEPGDVLAISDDGDRQVELSGTPYSTKVIGIYSTKPGILGSRHQIGNSVAGDIPVAMIGIVPCKATAENGSIHRGDLLVTSSIPGRVMKATDRSRIAGAVVGKAMEPLESGTGLIEIAVTLQ